MASERELTTYYYSPLDSAMPTNNHVTFWQLYERAARARYGEDITIIKTPLAERMVNNIEFQVTVVDKEREPREATRTIVGITTKEYSNRGKDTQDETVVKIYKTSPPTSKGERYSFFTTEGVNFGIGGNIAAQVMGLSITGGSLRITGQFSATEQSNEHGYSVSYHQEEKISVPPGTRVTAKIVSYSIKYEMFYTLKFSVKRSATVPLVYMSNCQRLCFRACRSSGVVYASDMISTLPNYNGEDADGTASFVQTGTLFWIGEGCSVDKLEESL